MTILKSRVADATKLGGWDKEKRRIKQYYNAKTAELVRSRMDRDWDDNDDYRGYDHDWGGMGRRHDGMMRRRDDR